MITLPLLLTRLLPPGESVAFPGASLLTAPVSDLPLPFWLNGVQAVLPRWLLGAALVGGSAFLIITIVNLLLRRQVNRRTAELEQRGAELEQRSAELEQRTRELQSLLDASRDLAAIRDLHELLYQIARHAVDLLDADEAILMQMIDQDHLRPTLMLGDHTEETLHMVIPLGQGLSGFSVANNLPLIVNNAQDDPRAVQVPGTAVTDVEHIMVTPLVFRDQVAGALLVNRQNKPGFTPAELRVLMALAQHCSTAIENARLYGELEKHNTSLEKLVEERTRALQTANENLSRLSSLKDEFVSNVSHELRTPIASLKLRRYLLARQPEAAATHLDVMERETHRLEEIVEDLLYISRLDQGRITLTSRPVDLNALVAEIGSDRAPLAEDRDLSLHIEAAPQLPPVMGDPGLISQVISILLTNALNYTPCGGTITIQTLAQGHNGHSWVGFSVSDTGPGVPPEEQDRIFERFYRGSAARDSGRHGTGLGLSIAQQIIRRHQGEITLSSPGPSGQGAAFTALLPAGVPAPETDTE
ncbi:MAG: GAF domain-containing protein [Anaerolineae bacterium]|nr:GAF domain-containing protein [Anaerolineae bacterium]